MTLRDLLVAPCATNDQKRCSHIACTMGSQSQMSGPQWSAPRSGSGTPHLQCVGAVALAFVTDLSFEDLLTEAESRPVIGWDFSWLGERIAKSSLPWSYEDLLLGQVPEHAELLDMGTGGGEFLASLAYRPPRTVATESWPPNVECADRRLRPLGIGVVKVEAAPDNVDQRPDEPRGRLPFVDGSFGLVANRHESFVPAEIARVLGADGVFVTQQLGGDNGDYYDALELSRPITPSLTLEIARGQLEGAGLEVVTGGECEESTTFFDVGALAWYLNAIPWIVNDFSIVSLRPQLRQIHERIRSEGPLVTRHVAFWVMSRAER